MWYYEIWIHHPLTSVGVVHSTWPSWAMWHMHASTFNECHKKKKTLHILTHGAMRGYEFTYLVACINGKNHDIRERNVTIKSEIWTMNTHFLGFQDIREWVILWELILRSLGCTTFHNGWTCSETSQQWNDISSEVGWQEPYMELHMM